MIGFGIGHAVQGRWGKTGWIHTTLQVGAMAAAVFSVASAIGTVAGGDARSAASAISNVGTVAIIGWLVYSADRIWEIIDVWVLPSSMKVASEKGLRMTPTLYSQNNQGNFMGLQLQYKF